MKGFLLCLVVILAVETVRSQGPPTRTKKGSRPARRGDNVDRGLSSGADVPDGRRFAPPRTAPARPAARRPVAPARGRPAGPRRAGVPPAGGRPAARTRSGVPPSRRVAPFRQPAPRPAFNPLQSFLQPPAVSCDAYCDRQGYKPVCTIHGNQYDNDCYRQCRNEPRQCENPCPCPADGADPMPGQAFSYSPFVPFQDKCAYCRDPFAYGEDYNPVCVEDDVTLYNECEAHCKGKTIICSSHCPC